MEIGSRVKKLRLAKKIKAIDLARMANISQPYLSDIEKGRTKPSFDTLESICKALGITLSDFFAEDTSSYPPDLLQLVETAKKLPPEERKALTEYLKIRLSSIDETSSTNSSENEQREEYATDIVVNIPLVGTTAAGSPITAIGYYEGNFEVPGKWGDFAVKVQGDSMEPLIPNEGFVFVRRQNIVNNNEIALVKVFGEYEDEVTIKRVRFVNDVVHLISENPEYKPMVYSRETVKILGKVVKWLSKAEGNKYLRLYV